MSKKPNHSRWPEFNWALSPAWDSSILLQPNPNQLTLFPVGIRKFAACTKELSIHQPLLSRWYCFIFVDCLGWKCVARNTDGMLTQVISACVPPVSPERLFCVTGYLSIICSSFAIPEFTAAPRRILHYYAICSALLLFPQQRALCCSHKHPQWKCSAWDALLDIHNHKL